MSYLKRILAVAVMMMPVVAQPASGTDLLVYTSLAVQPCGMNIDTFTSTHRGDIYNLSNAHRESAWKLEGTLAECAPFVLSGGYTSDFPYSVGIKCEKLGFPLVTQSLTCIVQQDKGCFKDPRLHARTTARVKLDSTIILERQHDTICQPCRSDVEIPDDYVEIPEDY